MKKICRDASLLVYRMKNVYYNNSERNFSMERDIKRKVMRVIQEVVCSHCGEKQVKEVEDLLKKSDLFWSVCEFCNRYGLEVITRRKLTIREWMEALYNTIGFRGVEVEAFLKEVSKNRPPL